MFRKKDIIMIIGVLVIALVVYGATWFARTKQSLSGMVNISVDGKQFQTVKIGDSQTVRVEQENGAINIVEITHNCVKMEYSSCKNQLCIHQGEVTVDNWTRRSMGRSIICLPNRVVVELALDQDAVDLTKEDPPDV